MVVASHSWIWKVLSLLLRLATEESEGISIVIATTNIFVLLDVISTLSDLHNLSMSTSTLK